MDAVVKVGGSLAEMPSVLKALGAELSRLVRKHLFVVVPGGGRLADIVRELDEKYALPPVVSHRLAIVAMDQYGLLLSHIIPESATFDLIEDAQRLSESGRVPIFLPSKLMSKDNSLEASWDVTSDSIAAHVAVKLRAKRAILVTDVDGIFTEDPKKQSEAELLSEVSVDELLKREKRTSVDKFLPKLLLESKLDCYVVNGMYPERIGAVLSGQRTICTRIVQSTGACSGNDESR